VPAYFFDISDGGTMVSDQDGLEISDRQTLRAEAVRAITEIGRDRMRSSLNPDQVMMTVRDADGRTIMVLSLSLAISDVRS